MSAILEGVLSLMRADLPTLEKLYISGRKEEVKALITNEEYRQPYFHQQLELQLGKAIDRGSYINLDWSKAYQLTSQGLLHAAGGDYLKLSMDVGLTQWTLEMAGYHDVPLEELRRIFDLDRPSSGALVPSSGLDQSLKMACRLNHKEVVRFLLEDLKADPTLGGQAAFNWACGHGHIEIVKLFLEGARVDPNYDNGACLHRACECNQVAIVDLLLKDGRVLPSRHGSHRHLLVDACTDGYLEVARLLIQDPRIDAGSEVSDCLKTACYKGHIDVVQLLLNEGLGGADLDKDQCCNLINALSPQTHRQAVKDILMSHGRTKEGKFKADYLSLACWVGCLEVVEELLENPDLTSQHISECFDIAQSSGNLSVVSRLLADHRIDPVRQYIHSDCRNDDVDINLLKLFLTSPAVKASLTIEHQMRYYALLYPSNST